MYNSDNAIPITNTAAVTHTRRRVSFMVMTFYLIAENVAVPYIAIAHWRIVRGDWATPEQ
jgi:hypothetical protein